MTQHLPMADVRDWLNTQPASPPPNAAPTEDMLRIHAPTWLRSTPTIFFDWITGYLDDAGTMIQSRARNPSYPGDAQAMTDLHDARQRAATGQPAGPPIGGP